jgi:FtsP/CotA-like multicopper oxidase with cupredoxin domain
MERESGPTPATTGTRAPQEIHVTLEARETVWEIAPGRTVSAWGYQGMVPGSMIVAHVGDTLVAHLINHLPEPTVIHWHGLRLPSLMDGTESVQTVVQPGESFEYRFTLPDAGTFWYHSHANETVQIERGLYGALIVLDPNRVLVLDDVKLDRKGRIAKTALFDRHSGREGQIVLINGRAQPTFEIAAGQTERWRIVNASNARYVLLSLGGRPFRVIGSDGGLRDAATLHGFFFQVIAIDGAPTPPTSWEETVNVVAKGRVTIAFRADDRPGVWMYHCHILEHHATGMMGHFEVVR